MLAKPGNKSGSSNIRNTRRGLRGSGDGDISPISQTGGTPAKGTSTSVEVPGYVAAGGNALLDVAKRALGHAAGDALTDVRRNWANK